MALQTTTVLFTSLAIYTMSFIMYAVNFFANKTNLQKVARLLTLIAFITTTTAVVLRTIEAGHLPFSNLFEFALSFLWGMSLVFLVVEFKYQPRGLGLFFTPLIISMAFWILSLNTGTSPLMPALRSNWLYIHVATAIIAYGAFAVSFTVAIMYLIKEQGLFNNLLPSLEKLDNLTYKIISFAMPFLTLLIITGAIWAEEAWGSYWDWDPKETWSLITWLIYAAYLHTRLLKGWKGRKTSIVAIIGFLAVMFTFVGVSYLLPGQHSYL